jgi:hypothetical protein
MKSTLVGQCSRLLSFLFVLALGLGLAGCGGGGGGDDVLSRTTLSSTMTGDQEVPPVITGATGRGSLSLQPATRDINGSVSLEGMTATAVHIHVGDVGVSGPIIVTLAQTAPGTWTVPSGVRLSDDQKDAFNNGRLYFNAHTAANPNGEIRGQIGRDVFSVRLTPLQEVPPRPSTASGTARLILNPETRTFTANLAVSGMRANAAHIHRGSPGVNGPIVFPLTETSAGSGEWVSAPGATLDDAQLAQLRAGELYFNAHSTLFPDGEIRGQIARNVGRALLTGLEEVPPTLSTATGSGTLVIDPTTRAATGSITLSGMTATQAHIHIGPTGVNGPIIVPLANTAAAPNVWSVPANTTLTAEQFAAFTRNDLYYNAHSTQFPNGEIRGQIRR